MLPQAKITVTTTEISISIAWIFWTVMKQFDNISFSGAFICQCWSYRVNSDWVSVRYQGTTENTTLIFGFPFNNISFLWVCICQFWSCRVGCNWVSTHYKGKTESTILILCFTFKDGKNSPFSVTPSGMNFSAKDSNKWQLRSHLSCMVLLY